MSAFSVVRDETSAPFYEAAAGGRLLTRICPVCSSRYPPQARRCHDSDSLGWVEASGLGVLVTWAVDHSVPLDPVLAAPRGATSVFGIVELDEGPWMQVPIVGVDPDTLTSGSAMRVCFVRPGGGESVPAFTSA